MGGVISECGIDFCCHQTPTGFSSEVNLGLARSTHSCLKLNCPIGIFSNTNEVRVSAKRFSGGPPCQYLYWQMIGHIIQSEKKTEGCSFHKINFIPFWVGLIPASVCKGFVWKLNLTLTIITLPNFFHLPRMEDCPGHASTTCIRTLLLSFTKFTCTKLLTFLNPIEERDLSRRRKKENQHDSLPCSSSESPLKKDCDKKKGKAKRTGLEE